MPSFVRSLSPQTRRRWRIAGTFSLVAVSLMGLKGEGCSGGVTDPDAVIESVDLTPDTVRLAPGATATVNANAFDKDDRRIMGRTATWQSLDPSVATIASSAADAGLVTAVKVGTTDIVGTVEGRSARSTIIVAVPTVAVDRVTLSGVTTGLAVLDSSSVAAGIWDAQNNLLGGRVVNWTVSDPSIAEVRNVASNGAYLVAKKLGTTTVTATVEGKSASATVTVTSTARPARITASVDTVRVNVGAEATVKFTAFDAAGVELPDSAITLTLPNATTARFAPSNAATVKATGRAAVRVAGIAPGVVTITADGGRGASDLSVPVVVSPAVAVPTSITITPKTASLRTGTTLGFSATVATSTGGAYAGTIGYTVVGSGASITASGTLSATQPGNLLVIASAGSLADTARVLAFGVDSVRIAPRTPITLIAGGSASITATAYGNKQVLANEPITWSSTAPSVVDVVGGSTSAALTAKAAGSASIIAASGGKSDTVPVTVTAAPTGGSTLDVHPLGIFSIKRLADGSTQTFNSLFLAGDHEANGDKTIQAFASYLFSGLPANATVTAATLQVRFDPAVVGAPFTGLGPLVVELSSASSLNEGPISTSAIVIANAITPSTVTIDVFPLIRSARNAGMWDPLESTCRHASLSIL